MAANAEEYLTADDFLEEVKRKGKEDGVLVD